MPVLTMHHIGPPRIPGESAADQGGNVIEQGKAQGIVMPFVAVLVMIRAADTVIEHGAIDEPDARQAGEFRRTRANRQGAGSPAGRAHVQWPADSREAAAVYRR